MRLGHPFLLTTCVALFALSWAAGCAQQTVTTASPPSNASESKAPVTPPTKAAASEKLLTMVYDVSDLVLGVKIGSASGQPVPPSTTPSDLLKKIQEEIAPGTWGLGGVLSYEPERLTVTHTAEVQAQVQALLNRLSATTETRYRVQMRFALLSPAAVSEIVKKENLSLYSPPLLMAEEGVAQHPSLVADIDPVTAKRVIAFVEKGEAGVKLLTAPRVTLFAGQRASVLAGKLVKYETRSQAEAPLVGSVQDGIATRLRLERVEEGKATLTLRVTAQDLVRVDQFKSGETAVQLPAVRTVSYQYEGRVPVGSSKMIVEGELSTADVGQLMVILLTVERYAGTRVISGK